MDRESAYRFQGPWQKDDLGDEYAVYYAAVQKPDSNAFTGIYQVVKGSRLLEAEWMDDPTFQTARFAADAALRKGTLEANEHRISGRR